MLRSPRSTSVVSPLPAPTRAVRRAFLLAAWGFLGACGNASQAEPASGGANSTGGVPGSKGSGGASTAGGMSGTGGSLASGGTGTGTGGASEPSAGVGGVTPEGGRGGAQPASGGRSTNPTGGAAGSPAAGAGGTSTGGASAGGGGTSARGGAGSNGGRAPTAGTGAGGDGPLTDVSAYLAGDSTVSTYTLDPKNPKSQAGWGQMLAPLFDSKLHVINNAVGGRTALRFIQEGSLDAIVAKLKPGDYLFVQFGTNDSNTTATYELNGVTYPYYAAADTDFKTNLKKYIDAARGKQALPVLVTPPPRNSAYCDGGRSMAAYGQAMLDLGKSSNVPVVDLGLKAHTYLKAICPKPTTGAQETFFKVNTDGSIDGTHFQENGARILAGFVADGIAEAGLPLARYRLK